MMVSSWHRTSWYFGVFILALIWCTQTARAQDDLFALWPDSTLAKANSAKDVDYMNEEEKEAVFYTNLARINPPLFADTYLKDYLKANKIKKDKDIKELISDLEEAPRMRVLQPSEPLTEMARSHAKDMGESGRTGHQSSDGTSFRKRSEKYEAYFSAINENCNYGNDKGVDAVIDLLIDRKVPNAGHRRNMLDPEMTHIGIAIEPHVRWRHNFVQDFGARKK
jgi:uncharacterized protein YkwD